MKKRLEGIINTIRLFVNTVMYRTLYRNEVSKERLLEVEIAIDEAREAVIIFREMLKNI